ncbi:MAG: haloacid dehalogenase-like hydrolase [Lachnospiraceae bacterium]|nr:haloacid dehalogenase-like hydrolase [Candidatus Minthocola equi]
MNVYDFDGTIYEGDSSIDFYLYTLKKYPRILKRMPAQLVATIGYLSGKEPKTKWKQALFSFLPDIPDIDAHIAAFCDSHYCNIYKWYLDQQSPEDIIISASADFLIRPMCERLGVRYLIPSHVDKHTGHFDGENCRDKEKINRMHRELGDIHIDNFYSDSHADDPLAAIAGHAYMIKKGIPIPWPDK